MTGAHSDQLLTAASQPVVIIYISRNYCKYSWFTRNNKKNELKKV